MSSINREIEINKRKRRLSKKERKDLKRTKKANEHENTPNSTSNASASGNHVEVPVEEYLDSYSPIAIPTYVSSKILLSTSNINHDSDPSSQSSKSLGPWFPKAVVFKCPLTYTNTGRTQVSDSNMIIDPNVLRESNATVKSSLGLFYQYYTEQKWDINKIELFMNYLSTAAKKRNIGGRIRVAQEGVNATVSAVDIPPIKVNGKQLPPISSKENIRHFIRDLKTFDGKAFATTDFKIIDDLPPDRGFKELKVIPVKELVFYGIDNPGNEGKIEGGEHVDSVEFHNLLQNDNAVVIDVRNHYETVLGRFDGQSAQCEGKSKSAEYIDPLMRKSTDFPLWLEKPETQAKLKGKEVLMYCTGGIRCEKASQHLKRKMGDNVKRVCQLQGGIERYFKTFPDGGMWRGKNFVFDKREAVSATNFHGDGGVISKKQMRLKKDDNNLPSECCVCGENWDRYVGKKKCFTCGVPILMCDKCMSKKSDMKTMLSARCPLCVSENVTVPASEVNLTNNGITSSCVNDDRGTIAKSILKWGGGKGKKKKLHS